jgi:ParB/RepB/Spo0J family partition protein
MPTIVDSTGNELDCGRIDVLTIPPHGILVDWSKNIGRGGVRPPVNDSLIALAKDMLPKRKAGDTEDGSSGQLEPVICRRLKSKQVQIVSGYRRLAAALELVDGGVCPDFKLKCSVSEMSDGEAALVNIAENLLREDPEPVQTGHAVRMLIEDYGFTLVQVANRLKQTEDRLSKWVKLTALSSRIQSTVTNGDMSVHAALELAEIPSGEQSQVFEELKSKGKVTAKKVREKRREKTKIHDLVEGLPTGKQLANSLGSIHRTPRELAAFIELKTGPLEPGSSLACSLIDYLDGKIDDDEISRAWDESFYRMAEEEVGL